MAKLLNAAEMKAISEQNQAVKAEQEISGEIMARLQDAAKKGKQKVCFESPSFGVGVIEKLKELGYKVSSYTPYGVQDDGRNKPSVTVEW